MPTQNRREVRLLAGHKSSGEPVYERVLMTDDPGSAHLRVVATPGLVLDIAAGDILDVDTSNGTFRTISRGQNIAVQVYGSHQTVDALIPAIAELGGWLDSRARDLTVFTVPYRDGFDSLEQVLRSFTEKHAGIEWYYGNVYDPVDGTTPLNWWRRT